METHFATYVIRLGKPVKPADKLDFFRRYISNVKEFQVVFTMNNMVKLVHNNRGGKDSFNEFQPDVIIALYKQHASLLDHNNKADMIERRPQIETELNHVNALRRSTEMQDTMSMSLILELPWTALVTMTSGMTS